MMTCELRNQLAETRATVDGWNAAVDEAQQVVREVEKALNDLHVGHCCGVGVSSSPFLSRLTGSDVLETDGTKIGRDIFWTRRLRYMKIKDEWRIVVEQGTEYQPNDTEEAFHEYEDACGEFKFIADPRQIIGWSSLPRSEKLDSVALLPSLVKVVDRVASREAFRATLLADSARRLSDALSLVLPADSTVVGDGHDIG